MQVSVRTMALVLTVLGAGTAQAQTQTPMQFWHQEWVRSHGPSGRQGGDWPRRDGWFGGDVYGYADPADEGAPPPRPRGPMPRVHVGNPDFYDYKPDTLTTVPLGDICGGDSAAQSPFARACAADATQNLRVLPQVGQALAAWYGAHAQYVWSDGRTIGAKALAAMAVLGAADAVGLDPADYRVAMPSLDGLDRAAAEAALMHFDLALSAKALTYVLDATRGRIDPDRLSGYHDLPRKTVDLLAAMETITQQEDVAPYLLARNPDNPKFRALVAELARLAAAPKADAGTVAKVEMALERLRWLPRDFGGRYVFLNEPAFEVSYVDRAGKPLTMRAVVGRPDAQTYVFVDRIRDVQYNPYWNVPRSIVINEMLPRLYRDGSYLDSHGYEVLNRHGRQIASNSVDWAAFAHNAAAVEVRQPPGRRNALGLLKIEFPNRHAIYMHDTPEKSLFKRDMRALSHGCVRLEHPKEMAAALLGKSVRYVEKQIARGVNASERVTADIPVYLAYFTAWPDAGGAVHYYDDVYRRDAHLATAIAKTAAARTAR